VVAPIDVTALRAERERRRGHDTRAHFRAEIHDYARHGWLAPAGDTDITVESLNRRIAAAKNRLP
jgi:hypothetical protein